MDAKQRELIGNFRDPGRTYRRKSLHVLESDYPSDADGVAIPYGVYDPIHNEGFVVVGTSHQTSKIRRSLYSSLVARLWAERQWLRENHRLLH